MMATDAVRPEPNDPLLALLDPDEAVAAYARARNHRLVVTERRLVVAHDDRVALDIRHRALRRIQFDIERDRPATLVIVPERPNDEPQVLSVPPDRYDEMALALAYIGRRLDEERPTDSTG